MMTADIERFWIEKARQPNWRDYILPRKDAGAFDYEGWIEAQRLFYFIGPESTVIDYGCGVGRVLRHVAARVRYAVGLDVCPAFLERAREYVGRDNVSFFHPGHYGKEGVADLVYCLMVMQHNDAASRERIITHIHKLLKAGGTAIIGFPSDESNYYQETGFVHKFARGEVAAYGAAFHPWRVMPGNLPNYERDYDRDLNHEMYLIAVK